MADRHRAKNAPKSKTRRQKGRHRAPQRLPEPHMWLGAGAVALGVGAALATGSGTAHADGTASGSSAGGSASGSSSGTTSGTSAAKSSTTNTVGATDSSTKPGPGSPSSSSSSSSSTTSSSTSTGTSSSTSTGTAGGHTSAASTPSTSGNAPTTATAASTTSGTSTASPTSPSTPASTGSPGPAAAVVVAGSTGSTTPGTTATGSTGAATISSSKSTAALVASNTHSGTLSTLGAAAATGQGAGITAAAVVTNTGPAGPTGSIGSSAGPASTVASTNTAAPVAAAAAVTTPVTAAAAAVPVVNPFVSLLAGFFSLFGVNTPVAPANPFLALFWGVFRSIENGFGMVPVAGTPTVGVPALTTGVVTGTLNFTEPAGLPLTYAVTTNPTQGTVTVDSTGAFTYTPNAMATQTTDTFTVTASDGPAATNETVTVPVATASGGQVNKSVPLYMVATTEPVVYVSVNGGQSVPVLVDTGSEGLVILAPDVGQTNLGNPTGTGSSGYSGGLNYTYTTYTTTVDFGNGIVTAPTSVDIVDSTSQTAFANYFAPAGVVGVLGIGPNAGGPGPSIVTNSLPGALGDGVLLNESGGQLEFGPNPLTSQATLPGAPYTPLEVSVNNGPKVTVNAAVDSGGVYGTIPSSVIGNSQTSGDLPVGDTVSVYTADGQTLLYTYTTTATNSPTVVSGTTMDTGFEPFSQGPIYVTATGTGTTVFDA